MSDCELKVHGDQDNSMPDSAAAIKPSFGAALPRAETIDWYSKGESRTVIIDGLEVRVRLVGRKGRRARIVISAPAGAQFCEV